MAFLSQIVKPKGTASGGFLGSVVLPPKGYIAPVPAPVVPAKPTAIQTLINGVEEFGKNLIAGPLERVGAVIKSVQTGSLEPLKESFKEQAATQFAPSKLEKQSDGTYKYTPSPILEQLAYGFAGGEGAGAKLSGTKLEKPVSTISEPTVPTVAEKPFLSTVTTPKLPKPVTGTGVSKAASDINRTLVDRGFNELPQEELARYTPITKEDQIQKVSTLLKSDEIAAKRMASGDEPIPSEINSQVLFNAVKNKALETGDFQTLKDLASSPLASERALAAQKLGASGFNNGEIDPVSLMQQITKSRVASVEKRQGAIKQVKANAVKDIKTEVSKVNNPKTWTDFVKSIECNY